VVGRRQEATLLEALLQPGMTHVLPVLQVLLVLPTQPLGWAGLLLPRKAGAACRLLLLLLLLLGRQLQLLACVALPIAVLVR
jgi:hypothetical protein